MGWSWSVYFYQKAREFVVEQSDVFSRDCVCHDFMPTPDMTGVDAVAWGA